MDLHSMWLNFPISIGIIGPGGPVLPRPGPQVGIGMLNLWTYGDLYPPFLS